MFNAVVNRKSNRKSSSKSACAVAHITKSLSIPMLNAAPASPDRLSMRNLSIHGLSLLPGRSSTGTSRSDTLVVGNRQRPLRKRCGIVIPIVLLMGLSACASTDGSRDRTRSGALIGAVIGAAAGNTSSDSKGAIYGAIAGALIGSAVGNYMDRQQREIEDELAEEISRREIAIERLQDETLKLSLSGDASFDVDSIRIKPAFEPTLQKLSTLLDEYDKTALHLIGHTDSTGSNDYNQQLSEERSGSVSTYLQLQGVDSRRLLTEGRGESQPRSDNTSSRGRLLNRRVDIFIKPIVEGREQDAFDRPA